VIKDKTFFFLEYQGTRIRTNQGGLSAFVPTAANLSGDFSPYLNASSPANPLGKVVAIKDPLNGQVFPNNQIPVSRFDTASLNVAKLLPAATSPSGSVFFAKPDTENYDETMARVDHTISNSDRIFVRYFWDRYDFLPVFPSNNILAYATGSHIPYQNTVLRENHIFRSNLLNDFRFSYIREGDVRIPPNTPNLADLGVNGIWLPPQKAIETISASGYFSFGDASQANIPRQAFAWSDDLRWVLGRHYLSMGGEFERDRFDIDTIFRENPSIAFSGDSTGTGLSDFILGSIRTYNQSNGLRLRLRGIMTSLYIQDNFHLNPRLTLNFGLRWEPSIPWQDLYGQQDIFRPDAYAAGTTTKIFQNAPPGLFFPGDPGVPPNGNYPDWNNFGPRVGFAWSPSANGKTSVRGGAGVFYDARFTGYYLYHEVNTPFSEQLNLTSPTGPFSNPLLGIVNPFPLPQRPKADAPFPNPVLIVSWDPKGTYVSPTIYQWNLTIEHQFAGDWLARVAYVATRSTHLNEDVELNPAVYTPGSTLSTDQRRLFPGLASTQQECDSANGWYNGLQVSLEKRYSHGLTVLANYAWSKSLDNLVLNKNAPSIGVGNYTVLPWYFPDSTKFDRGLSDFDPAHRFVTSAVWQTPKMTNPVLRALASNWDVGGIVTAQTGDPLTVLAGLDRSQTGLGKTARNMLAGRCSVRAPATTPPPASIT
jgi:hypothetical protein